jgi:D-arabinose 1-dehydrogenase-like Zn-dependent alcohol dehydrogenase
MGIRPIVIDTGDEKKNLAHELGAEFFIDFKTSEDVAAEVIKLTDGIGAHGVFVTAPQSYPTALNYLGSRVNGIVMCIGLPPAGQYTVRSRTTFLNLMHLLTWFQR